MRFIIAFVIMLLASAIILELVRWHGIICHLRMQKSQSQWNLEYVLSWKCYQANYFWWLPFRWAKKRSLQAARFLRCFSQGEAPMVIVRWSPAAPSKRCYRLYNRFDLSS